MNSTHLGPLERAVLRALVHAEALGATALNADSLWRILPGYATHPANVRAALADGAPLRHFLRHDGGRFALQDRPDAFAQADAEAESARVLWSDVSAALRGLAKLPWIEAVAVSGPAAFGYAPAGQPLQVVLLAEGGRSDEARAAFTASLRSRGPVAERIRLLEVYDADGPAPTLSSEAAALRFATLRPVTNPRGWGWLRSRVAGLDVSFPNAPWEANTPDFLLADRLDGRLAQVRRGVLGGGHEVLTEANRTGNRRLLLDRVVGGLVRRLAGEVQRHPEDLRDSEARWAEVQDWEIEVEVHEPDAVEPDVIEPAAATPIPEAPALERSTPPEPAAPSRRKRGPTRRPLRTATGASASTGRRARRPRQ